MTSTIAPTFVQIDARKRASLGSMAKFDQYLVREEPNGTIIFEPAIIMTPAEREFVNDPELVAALARVNANPERRRTRERRGARSSAV
ncbi:hypothetical protein [Clavibacter michiganensis]|uniref:Uncharacterized protein n=1 Tax=Clavibacter michiganensis subsp. insidiosus TaxID=33014 RepID=A0A0D5CH67_9MICO|nr:hypothetical protein [Clavibacter michiganensis]AJW79003.1 hypothetical protein VO01_07550 [Clavibacter michiganensis subsp. insidiosus]AWF98308.1 hypothetical protein BEH61_07290 [Clavibacter michiganensis subsp. insidiosus]OQJ59978.1 hypothetical protein B5P21_08685 [Clavibacter michiganensis subsp. insidiosus]RII88422.1 hypothetical protein DZF92_03165 [Clavibacter michiganensis subsp. insidiosus]RIJ44383.1 hypothetical protein DZF93_03075 [Clavibacter michiganensis subsp. insidiosus]